MTEKSQSEQNAAQRQKELLAEALEKAEKDGVFLNSNGKTAPRLYPGGNAVSPFNALVLALHSDRNGYKTNLYMPFTEAKKRGEAVQSGEKGVPFIWYRWNEYQSKMDKDHRISKEEYGKLSEEDRMGYSPVRDREIRMLFNVEQTTLPMADKESFLKAVGENGSLEERGLAGPEVKKVRMEVNRFLQNMAANLVPVRKDGIGIAHYDPSRDVVHLPSQKHFASYGEYVQEAIRQVVSATGHPQRISRPGVEVEGHRTPTEAEVHREKLVIELASAVKMNELGLPARISPENQSLIEDWRKSLEERPWFINAIEADVNNAVNMIGKAERGVKIEKKETPELPQEQKVNTTISLIQDDDGKWAMYLKPENEKGFSVYPEKADLGRYFAMLKKSGGKPDDRLRQEMAQKYYALASADPSRKVDLFVTREKDLDLSMIQRVSVVKTKDGSQGDDKSQSRVLCYPTIKGVDKVEPREVSPSQWQRMWLAEDKTEYKRNLVATLFADVLRERQQIESEKQQEEKRMNSPEQKAKEELEEKRKEELTRAETKLIGGVVAAGIAKDVEEQSRGFHR